jgi:flavin-dependent dehydrogenase
VARGRLLLAGDAAALINPLTGEGIYYAITSGLAAGAAAACPQRAGDIYRRALRRRFGAARLHTAILSALTASGTVFEAGMRAAAARPDVFDDLATLGLAEGRITGRLIRALLAHL